MHSYILKYRSRYLKKLKSEIHSSTVLFLGDFAENYQFVIQDEVQGFHWNNSQCTLHRVVTYYQENDEMKNIFYCVISDDRKHDVPLVHEVQKAILANLKCKLHGLSSIQNSPHQSANAEGFAKVYLFFSICLSKKNAEAIEFLEILKKYFSNQE